jgi:hypothetical protein
MMKKKTAASAKCRELRSGVDTMVCNLSGVLSTENSPGPNVAAPSDPSLEAGLSGSTLAMKR